MQRIESAGLLGTFGHAPRPAVDLAGLVVQAREAVPDPVAPVLERKVPVRSTPRPRFESRPAGVRLAQRGGIFDMAQRLNAGDPTLTAYLLRNPEQTCLLMALVDRLLKAV